MHADLLFPIAPSLPNGPAWLILRAPRLAQVARYRLVSHSWHAWIMHPNHYGHDFQAVLDHRPKRKDVSPAGPVRDLTTPVLCHRLVTDISLDCSRLSDHGLQILSEKIAQNLRTITLRNCSGDNITLVGLLAITKKLSLEITSFTIGECPWLSATDAGRLQRAYPMVGCRPIFINCPRQHQPDMSDQDLLQCLEPPQHKPIRFSDLFRPTTRGTPPAHCLVRPLTHLDLSGRLSLSNEQIGTIIGILPADIAELNFSRTLISDNEIPLLRPFPHLRSLRFNECANLTSSAVNHLAHWIECEDGIDYQMGNCPNIQTLDLSNCGRLTDTQVAKLIDILHPCNISAASLVNCKRLTKDSLSILTKHFTSLEQIDLMGCSFTIDAQDLFTLLPVTHAILPNGELVFRRSTTDPLFAQILEQRQGVATSCLDLTGCAQLTDASLPLISAQLSSELSCLSLAGCTGLGPEGFSSLGKHDLPHLTELDLSQCAIGEESRWMPRGLKRLKLCNAPLTFSSNQQLQKWVASLPKGLERLELVNAGVTSDLLLALAKTDLPLSHIDLRDNLAIDGQGLAELLQAFGPSLETLDVTGCDGLTGHGFDLLRTSMPPKLTHLGLGITRLDSQVFCPLIPRLPTTLMSLDLSGSCVGDRALQSLALAQLPRLTHLKLTQCSQISELGVTSLLHHLGAQLARFDLSGTSIQHLRFTGLPAEVLANMGSLCFPKDLVTLDHLVIETSEAAQDQPSFDRHLASLPPVIKRLEIRGSHLTDRLAKILAPNISKAESVILGGLDGLSTRSWQSIFTALLTRCSDLLALDLSSHTQLTDEELIAIARQSPHLQTLDISDCKHISNKALAALARHCPNLTSLSLENCSNPMEPGLKAIAKACTQLAHLNIFGCAFSESTIQFTIQHCDKLRSLNLAGSENVTDALLRALAGDLYEITHLNLQECTPFTGAGIKALARACEELEYLDLTCCWEIPHSALITLFRKHPQLTGLRLAEVGGVNETAVRALVKYCPNLTILDVSDCSLTEASIRDLAKSCTSLVELRLSGNNLTDETVRAIATCCPQLEVLDLCGEALLTDECIEFLAERCTHLRELNLRRCDLLTDRSVQALATHCLHLQRLNISSLGKLTERALHALSAHCYGLRDLSLNGCEIAPDELIVLLERLPKLRNLHILSLDLSATSDVVDHQIIALARRCHGLTTLNLSGCDKLAEDSIIAFLEHSPHIRTLDLSGCLQITDQMICALVARFPNLWTLNLSRCASITDRALYTIANHCPVLSDLNISHCDRVTGAGVEAIALQCPHMTKLNLAFCDEITDEAIAVVAEHCRGLSHLNIDDCYLLTHQAFKSLARRCANLESLSLGAHANTIDIGGSEIVALAQGCPKLTSWNLSGQTIRMTDEQWVTFARSSSELSTLNLKCHSCPNNGLIAIAQNCHKLRHLDLSEHEEVTDQVIIEFATNCSHLEWINLRGCSSLTHVALISLAQGCNGLSNVTVSEGCVTEDSVTTLAQNCPNLTDLDLSFPPSYVPTSAFALLVQRCHQLKVLNLSGALKPPHLSKPQVPPEVAIQMAPMRVQRADPTHIDVSAEAADTAAVLFAHAVHCPELTHLDLSCCSVVTDAEVIALAKSCPQLTYLNLGGCQNVTEAVIPALTRHCPKLTTLSLARTSCAHSDHMSDQLAHLSYSPLKDLDLSRCRGITDDALIALAPYFPRLERLRLKGCKRLTEGTILRLQSLFPRLESLTPPKPRGDL